MEKKAQQSRNDLAMLYMASLLLIVIAIGALYSFGIIGQSSHGSLIGSMPTAAVVAEQKPEGAAPLTIIEENTNETAETIEID